MNGATGISEGRAQIIVLVRAFEEADPEGLVIPLRDRVEATRRALMVTGLSGGKGASPGAWRIRNGEALLRRARLLYDGLTRRHPALRRIVGLTRLGASTAPSLLIATAAIGALVGLVGLEPRIDPLPLAMVALLGWNLVTYAIALAVAVAGRPLTPRRPSVFFAGLLLRWALWRRLPARKKTTGAGADRPRIVTKAVMRYGATWHRIAGPLVATRLRRLLHLAMVTLTAGVLLGLQLRAESLEYPASWKPDALSATTRRAVLEAVLAPASAVSGIALPDLDRLHWPQGGNPRPWIALWTVTALLFVALPRAILAIVETRRSRRLADDLPFDIGEAYFRGLFTAWRGSRGLIEVAPFGYVPRPADLAALRVMLFDFFGALAEITVRRAEGPEVSVEAWLRAAPAGDRWHDAGGGEPEERCFVLLLSLETEPDAAVHGRILRSLRARAESAGDRLLIVVDETPLRREHDDGRRARSRIEAWSRLAGEVGLQPLFVDLERTSGPVARAEERGVHQRLRACLWPPSSADRGID